MVDGGPAGTKTRISVINDTDGKSQKKNVGLYVQREQREKAQTRVTSLITEGKWV